MIKYITLTTAGSTGRYRMPVVSVTRRNNRGQWREWRWNGEMKNF